MAVKNYALALLFIASLYVVKKIEIQITLTYQFRVSFMQCYFILCILLAAYR